MRLSGGAWSMAALFNNTVYYAGNGDHLKAFPITNALLATTPASESATSFPYPGATPERKLERSAEWDRVGDRKSERRGSIARLRHDEPAHRVVRQQPGAEQPRSFFR